jgi:hypothetical protein
MLKAEHDNEKEDLCDQLAQQDKALNGIKQEIKDYELAKKEYEELVIQMQKRSIFLKKTEPTLLKLENEALRTQIKAIKNDTEAFEYKQKVTEEEAPDQEDNDQLEYEALLTGISAVLLDISFAESDNESIKEETEQLKEQASQINAQMTDKFDVDQVIKETLALMAKLELEYKDKRDTLKDVKNTKKKARKSSRTQDTDSLERPLRFLKQNRQLSRHCSDFLRRMSLALFDTLILKERLLENCTKSNKTLANRLSALTGDDPSQFYNPHDHAAKAAAQSQPNNIRNPVV